ncbi:MAG TPA: PP2C family protein-serine/threonine phosphatase, partial [Candidatus Obscuribacterales bacterium]
ILPAPITEPPVTIDSRFIPSRQLGGDGFDYYWLDPDHLVIYLLDTSGHGLRAALPSLSVMNLLKSRAIPTINYYQPSDVLKGLNETFQMTQRNDKYFTIWYGVYNRVKSQLIYSSAGHPPAVLFSSKPKTQVTRLRTPGLPIGMFSDTKYIDAVCEIEKSSTLYIFSDGIYEINQPDGTVWGLDSFIELIANGCNKSNYNLDEILNSIQFLHPNSSFDDDLSLLQVRFI